MSELTRRAFLAVTGAVGTIAAASPLKKFVDRLIPYVNPPEKVVPGEWSFFATTCRECPAGCGMHLWHRDGRVTKAEGNSAHPVNRGGLCPRGQSSLQGLYDPDRVRRPQRRERRSGRVSDVSWETTSMEIGRFLQDGNVSIVSGLETGTLRRVMERFVASFGSSRLLMYEPYGLEPLRAAHRKVFGLGTIPDYRIENSGHVVSFGAEFLESWVSPVGFTRRFGEMHSWKGEIPGRFTYVGPRLSMTAANADDFLLVSPGSEKWVAAAMLKALAQAGKGGHAVAAAVASLNGVDPFRLSGVPEEKIREIAASFASSGGIALAPSAAGHGDAAVETAAAAALLNAAAGSIGSRVDFSRPHALSTTATENEVERFLSGITGRDAIIIHNTNIAFTRPSAAEHLRRAGLVVYLGTLPDETAEVADWVLPTDSPLESWGDYEPQAGLHSVMQPTMARLWDSKPAGEILPELALAAGHPLEPSPLSLQDRLKSTWKEILNRTHPNLPFDEAWTQTLQRGFVTEDVSPVRPDVAPVRFSSPAGGTAKGTTLCLWPSIMLYDGRTANRGWMQEAPDPVSYASWSSWVDIHPKLAKRIGLADGDMVELSARGAKIEAPVRMTEEIHETAVGMTLGQGHTARGLSSACGVGANGFLLLGGGQGLHSVELRRTGKRGSPIYTSPTEDQHHREILQWTPLSELRRKEPGEGEEIDLPLPEGYDPAKNLYPPHKHRDHRWGMVVDLQKCIGCGACAVACYAENNIPVMGAKLLAQGREMAWLKVVPYRHPEKQSIAWLPMLCQHCDSAPCEPVCPVYAAVHNEEGLNAQIYNRCIGTRYCSNNCPYKVRRFNWFAPKWKEPLNLQLNPEVTVRCRGVMEKCTFCVQRIRNAEYRAIAENRSVREGEIIPACAQSCPAGVFSFGDLMDTESQVSKAFREDPRRYQVLKELNTKTAVLYLKRVDREG
jgi:anaerobic selenocysteine-containing dehydrogenase/Fe-S-cluster-containing dehydrogenase component